MIKVLPGDVLIFAAALSAEAVALARPSLAPAAGAVGGALSAVAYERAIGSLYHVFASDDVKRRRLVAAAAVGALVGGAVGVVRRDAGR